ncbi:MAG: hypothetical protein HFE84_07435 [Lachnospiraceae bacterium]|nr:hypothetical protein [Lachnospiraceae bacterium]
MKEKHNKKGRRLRLIPLLLGAYGLFLGLGLTVIGLTGIEEGIGMARLLLGLGMAFFGLYGIWDGVRDLAKPDKKPGNLLATPFILIDLAGNQSSNVTFGRLQEQLKGLMEKGEGVNFEIRLLSPISIQERGMLKRVLCTYQDAILLTAFFIGDEGGYWIYRESTGPDMAEEWFRQFLSGRMDFCGWEKTEPDADGERADANPKDVQAFGQESLNRTGRTVVFWHQLLVIFGESWHDEHKFFSDRDLELAIEGVHAGKYQKAVLEWGAQAVDIFPGLEAELTVIWRTNITGKGTSRFFAKKGTVTQVKFWLVHYLNEGSFEETSGWADITAQVEKEWRKHGKVL